MYTRCPGCHTVHPVNAALLARGAGHYRCGKCKKVANALEALFDVWPDASTPPPRPGSLPELGAPLQLDDPGDDPTPEETALPDEDGPASEDAERTSRRLLRIVWIAAALIIAVVAGLNVAHYFGVPLLDHPALQNALEKSGLADPPPEPEFRALDQIEIVTREMLAHPNRPGVLLLNATVVNRAGRFQPYPEIGITLLDLDNREIARQRFTPGDYLSRTAELRSGMTPGAYVGLSLEMPDPGEAAVGFEIEFY